MMTTSRNIYFGIVELINDMTKATISQSITTHSNK